MLQTQDDKVVKTCSENGLEEKLNRVTDQGKGELALTPPTPGGPEAPTRNRKS